MIYYACAYESMGFRKANFLGLVLEQNYATLWMSFWTLIVHFEFFTGLTKDRTRIVHFGSGTDQRQNKRCPFWECYLLDCQRQNKDCPFWELFTGLTKDRTRTVHFRSVTDQRQDKYCPFWECYLLDWPKTGQGHERFGTNDHLRVESFLLIIILVYNAICERTWGSVMQRFQEVWLSERIL